MLTSYFKSSRTIARYRSGLAGPFLDDFGRWLESRGYVQTRIRHHIRYVAHFGDWAREEGLTIKKCDQKSLNKLRSQLAKRNSLRDRQGNHNPLYQSARVFVTFLEATGLVVALHIKATTPELLREFCEWMRVQRGTLDTTLTNYRLCIISMLHSMGSEPKSYTAKELREFLVRHTAHSRPAKSKNMATALRMFLRFLIARGDCAAGLDHAIPTVALKYSKLRAFQNQKIDPAPGCWIFDTDSLLKHWSHVQILEIAFLDICSRLARTWDTLA